METSTASFCDVINSCGRNDAGRYHDGAYGIRSGVKESERAKVTDFLLSYFQDQGQRIRLLSLPGLSWSFENTLNLIHPKTQMVCLESSASVFHRSKVLMPGVANAIEDAGTCLSERRYNYGSAEFSYYRVGTHHRPKEIYARTPKKYRNCNGGNRSSRANRYLLMNTQTYASMFMEDFGASMGDKNKFRERFYLRNCVWLDFTSPLCASVNETLKNLSLVMHACIDDKPVAITIMNCRDGYSSPEARIEAVCALNKDFTYAKHWTYIGKGNTSMLTICGTIR